jgi:TolB-like protein
MVSRFMGRLGSRPRTETEFDGIAHAYARLGIPGRPPFDSGRLRLLLVCVLLLVAGAGVMGLLALSRQARDAAALDTSVIAILPFNVSGADPSLAYLREDLVHRLAGRLAASDAQTVEPRTTVDAVRTWRDGADPPLNVARRIAVRLGSGSLLLGSVVGGGDRITIHGTLVRTRDGLALSTASFTGSGDALDELVDRLAGAVLGAMPASPAAPSVPPPSPSRQ